MYTHKTREGSVFRAASRRGGAAPSCRTGQIMFVGYEGDFSESANYLFQVTTQKVIVSVSAGGRNVIHLITYRV